MTSSRRALAAFHRAVLDVRAHRVAVEDFQRTLYASEGLILINGTHPTVATPRVSTARGPSCLVVFSTQALARKDAAQHPGYWPWQTELWWLVAGLPGDWGLLINPGGPTIRLDAACWQGLRWPAP